MLNLLLPLSAVLGGGGIGFWIAERYRARTEELTLCLHLLSRIHTLLTVERLPLAALFKRLADSGEFSRLPFVEETARQLSSCPEFPTVFRRTVEASSSKLRSEDQKLLLTLADLLGAYDLDTQERGMESLRILLEEKREEAQQNQFTNGRLSRSLGILGGIALAILLV